MEQTKKQIVEGILGFPGSMLSGSKSSYSKRHPNNKVFFNGNIYGKDGSKLWYGDLDLTRDRKKLERLVRDLNETIYVTAEQPFRWEDQTPERLQEACSGEYPLAVRFDP